MYNNILKTPSKIFSYLKSSNFETFPDVVISSVKVLQLIFIHNLFLQIICDNMALEAFRQVGC